MNDTARMNDASREWTTEVSDASGPIAEVAAAKAAQPARLTKEQVMERINQLMADNGYLLLPVVIGASGVESPPEDFIPSTHRAVIRIYEAQR